MSFKAVASGMARRQGISEDRASAELAASTRRASPAAKRKNPKLNRVKMPKGAGSKIVKAIKPFAFSGIMGGAK